LKKKEKKEPVVKKEWIIPAAEEIAQKVASQAKLKQRPSK
jgi:hypothetical protein